MSDWSNFDWNSLADQVQGAQPQAPVAQEDNPWANSNSDWTSDQPQPQQNWNDLFGDVSNAFNTAFQSPQFNQPPPPPQYNWNNLFEAGQDLFNQGMQEVQPSYTPAPPGSGNPWSETNWGQDNSNNGSNGGGSDWGTPATQPQPQPDQTQQVQLPFHLGATTYGQLQQTLPKREHATLGDIAPQSDFDQYSTDPLGFIRATVNQADKENFGLIGKGANTVASGAIGALGAVTQPIGQGVDWLADESNIPGLQQYGQAVRGVYENTVDPAMNLLTSTIGGATNGDLTKLPLFRGLGTVADVVTDPNHDIGQAVNKNWQGVNVPTTQLYNAVFNNQQYTQEQTQLKQSLVQQAYDQAIAAGKSEEEAQQLARRANDKYSNPLTLAEQPGLEGYSKLPAWAQLGFSLADPGQNAFGEALFNPATKGVINAAKKGLDFTPLPQIGEKLGKVLESPEQVTNKVGTEIDQFAPIIKNVMDTKGGEEAGVRPVDVLDEILNDPSSPNYYQKLGLTEDAAAQYRRVVDNVKNGDVPLDTSLKEVTDTAKNVMSSENKLGMAAQAPEANPEATLSNLVQNNITDRGAPLLSPSAIADISGQLRKEDRKIGAGQNGAQVYAVLSDGKKELLPQTRDMQSLFPGYEERPTNARGPNGKPVTDPTYAHSVQLANGKTVPVTNIDKLVNSQGKTVYDAFPGVGKADKAMAEFFPQTMSGAKNAIDEASLKRYKEQGANSKYTAVKMPKAADAFTEYQRAAKDVLGLQSGKLSVTGPVGKLKLETNKPLAKLGPLGTALRVSGKTMPVFSRLYLNTFSRALRDPAGNVFKAKMEGYSVLNQSKVSARYSQIFGDYMPENLQHGTGLTEEGRELGKKAPEKTNKLAAAAYFVANPFNEGTSFALNKLTGGKLKDWNQVAEMAETGLKQHVYKQERLRQWDQSVHDAVRNGEIPASLKEAYRAGSLPPETIANFIAGRMPQGADLAKAITGEYHPLNISPDVIARNAKLFDGTGGQFGTLVGSLLDTLPDRVTQFNDKLDFDRAAYLHKIKNAKNPATRDLMMKTYEANFGKQARLEDITPDHPIMKQLDKEMADQVDEMFNVPVTAEAADPKVQQAVKDITKNVLEYAAKEKNLETFKQKLSLDIAGREDSYAVNYKTPLFDQLNERKGKATRREYYKAQGRAKKTGEEFTQEKPATPEIPDADRFSRYYDDIYGRDLPANIPNPNTLRVLMNRMSKVTPEQRLRYHENMLDMDDHIRHVTGNTFKLDPDTLTPVRISDGVNLNELTGRAAPEVIGTPLPQWPKDIPTDFEGALQVAKEVLGDKAASNFAELDPAWRDMMFSELAVRYGFPDPNNPRTMAEKLGLERKSALEAWDNIKQDMKDRFDTSKEAKATAQRGEEITQEKAQKITQDLLATRNRLLTQTDTAALKRVQDIYFDYGNKNLLDQALGSIIPFNYWARKNFVYAAKYFAGHPMHMVALLNFYKNLEKENQDNKVPDYARGNIYLWKNPDGSKVLWNFASVLPFNPLGDSDALMTTLDAADSDSAPTANQNPLVMLFGSEGKNGARNKGLIPTFFHPNPVIDIATKTGQVSEIYKALGVVDKDGHLFGNKDLQVGSNFGSPGPVNKQTAGLIPGANWLKDMAATSGLNKVLRGQGIIKSDLDLEAPINEFLFGRNAGKPVTKVQQQLTMMVGAGTISKDQALNAIAGLKEGNWTPEALTALDKVEKEDFGGKVLSSIGLSNVLVNTARQQYSDQLSAEYTGVKDDKGHYDVSTDPTTGKEVRTFVPGGSQEFFDKHHGAGSVMFSGSSTPQEIREGMADEKTGQAVTDLNKKYYDDKAMTTREFNAAMDKIKADNPGYFQGLAAKDFTQTVGLNPLKPGEKNLTYEEWQKKYGPTDMAARQYSETYDDFKRQTNSDKYNELGDRARALSDNGDKKGASAIYSSKEYKDLQSKRDSFMKLNPDFKSQYEANNLAKYGTAPKTDEDKAYSEKLGQYSAIGGETYDELTQQYNDLKNSGNTKAANAIYGSKEYQQVKTARAQFLSDNPEFADKYKAANEAKYGPAPTSATASKSYSSSAGAGAGSKTYYAPAKKTTYTPAVKSSSSYSSSSTAKKPYTPYPATTKKPAATNNAWRYATKNQSLAELERELGLEQNSVKPLPTTSRYANNSGKVYINNNSSKPYSSVATSKPKVSKPKVYYPKKKTVSITPKKPYYPTKKGY